MAGRDAVVALALDTGEEVVLMDGCGPDRIIAGRRLTGGLITTNFVFAGNLSMMEGDMTSLALGNEQLKQRSMAKASAAGECSLRMTVMM